MKKKLKNLTTNQQMSIDKAVGVIIGKILASFIRGVLYETCNRGTF